MITASAVRLLAVACLLAVGLLLAAAPASAGTARPVALPGPSATGAEPGAQTADGPAGGLAGPPTGRRLGLPVAVAGVAVLGAASLLVRVLLAEPLEG